MLACTYSYTGGIPQSEVALDSGQHREWPAVREAWRPTFLIEEYDDREEEVQ